MTMARSLQASVEGIEKAKDVFKQKGCTQDYLAGAFGYTRQTIRKFFTRKPIDKTIFSRPKTFEIWRKNKGFNRRF